MGLLQENHAPRARPTAGRRRRVKMPSVKLRMIRDEREMQLGGQRKGHHGQKRSSRSKNRVIIRGQVRLYKAVFPVPAPIAARQGIGSAICRDLNRCFMAAVNTAL